MFASTAAFRILATKPMTSTLVSRKMATITTGVEFDTIAREWRLKWSADGDKKSLAEVQKTLNKYTASLKKVDGVKSVQRVVCGGCLDYKVVVALPAEKWGAWVSILFVKLVLRASALWHLLLPTTWPIMGIYVPN